MKKFLTVAAAAFLTAAALALTQTTSAEDKRDPDRIYPACGVVVALDYDADVVTVKDVAGFAWTFEGVEDWQTGDVAALLMYDNGTQTIKDDEVLDVKYCGIVKWFGEIAANAETK